MFWSPLLRFIDNVRRHLPIALARHVVDRVAAEAGVDRSLGLVEAHSRFAVNTSPAMYKQGRLQAEIDAIFQCAFSIVIFV